LELSSAFVGLFAVVKDAIEGMEVLILSIFGVVMIIDDEVVI